MEETTQTVTVAVPTTPWYTSWTLGLNALAVVGEMVQLLAGAAIIPPGIATLVVAGLNIILRAGKTSAPVSFSGNQTAAVEVAPATARAMFQQNRTLFTRE